MSRTEEQGKSLAHFLLRFIWGGLCFTVLVYGGMVWLHQSGHNSPPVDGKWVLVGLFGALAVASLVGAALIPRWVKTAFTAQVLTWGLCESVGIYGLVLGLVGFPAYVWGSFSAVSLLALFWTRPARERPHEIP